MMRKIFQRRFFQGCIFALLFLCVATLTSLLPCRAQNDPSLTQTPVTSEQYYLITLIWNSEKNTLSLKEGTAVNLTEDNLLQDSGSGSQFYARVINFKNQPEPLKKGEYKIFLGQWKIEGASKEMEVRLTVPYFVDGSKVIVFNAKDKKTALVVDVSKLAKVVPATGSENTAGNNNKAQVPVKASPANQSSSLSSILWWVMGIVILLIFAGGGYFLYKRRKGMIIKPNIAIK